MTLPSITRGQIFRDDGILTSNYVLGGDVTPTLTTDGDNLTMTTTFTNAANQVSDSVYNPAPAAMSTTTYPFILIRHKDTNGGAAGVTLNFRAHYTDTTSQLFPLTVSTGFVVDTLSLPTGKSLDDIRMRIIGNNTTATVGFIWDFVYVFKQTLTLPSVTRPIRMRKRRYLNKLQILQREGDIVQDLGSSSPEFDLSGSFITTSQYGADVWPQVLDGLVLESSTVQADGNPTWQWFSSDLYQRKVLVMDAMVEDVPGRQRNTLNDYVLRLLQWDTIGQTTGALGAVS